MEKKNLLGPAKIKNTKRKPALADGELLPTFRVQNTEIIYNPKFFDPDSFSPKLEPSPFTNDIFSF